MNKRQAKKAKKNFYRLSAKKKRQMARSAQEDARRKGFTSFEEYARTLVRVD